MRNTSIQTVPSSRRSVAATIAVASFVVLSHAAVKAAPTTSSEAYSSPEQAANALYVAARNNDEQAMTRVLGTGKEAIASEDAVEDQRERERFVRKYQEMHRLVRAPDGVEILHIGAENWPFPFPIVSENGEWHFDAAAGMEEVVLRRIGEAEMTAMHACRTLGTGPHGALHEDSKQSHGELVAKAGDRLVPFHGYYFRRIDVRAKPAAAGTMNKRASAPSVPFTYVAYPAEYRVTGVMTFALGRDGTLYETDLGPDTVEVGKKISRLDSRQSWHVVDAR